MVITAEDKVRHSESPPIRGHRPRAVSLAWLALTTAVGTAGIVGAYVMASHGVEGNQYHLFWLGMGTLLLPIAAHLAHAALAPGERTILLALAGTAASLPHFLRAPTRPFMNDEFAHFLQAENMYRYGGFLQPNQIVTQAGNFPGLESLTVVIRHLTGLDTYRIASILVVLFHVAALYGVFALARQFADPRVAGLGAFVYAIGPQFPFFDSMFSYESMGVVLFIWTVALAAEALRLDQQRRIGKFAGVAFLGAICVLTHHLSSYATILALFSLSVTALLMHQRHPRAAAWALLAITVGLTAIAVAWATARHTDIATYLGVYVRNGASSLWAQVTGGSAQQYEGYVPIAASRSPFSGSALPAYEKVAAVLAQVALLLAFGRGLWLSRQRLTAPLLTAALLGTLYFASLPLIITGGGQNAAHRSWAFSFLGLSIVVAMGLDGSMSRLLPRLQAVRGERLQRMTVAAVTGVLLVGSYGAAVNDRELFPGKFIFQSDGRNVPQELFSVADWLAANGHVGQGFLADYRTAVVVAARTNGRPDQKLAADLMIPADISVSTESRVRQETSFVVVDNRLTELQAAQGYYFNLYEPRIQQPLPRTSVDKLSATPWLRVVHSTEHYTVYEVAS